MDPSGYGMNSMYPVGNAMENMEGKVCDVTDGKMEKSDPKVFWESPSQFIYSTVLGFFDPWYFIIHGIC